MKHFLLFMLSVVAAAQVNAQSDTSRRPRVDTTRQGYQVRTDTSLKPHVDTARQGYKVRTDTSRKPHVDTTSGPHVDTTALEEVHVVGEKKTELRTATTSQLDRLQLFRASGQTLGETLKSVPGLNSIQTGPSISKPVIHGLHSNRVLILNNGVRQEGQQWGTEHAPEIDPFIADRITIIKGAASVRYGSDALVGVLLVEPRILQPDRSFEGEAVMVAGTNGRSGALSVLTEGKIGGMEGEGEDQRDGQEDGLVNGGRKGRGGWLDGLNWRAQGTLKRAGNFSTAHYYLQNSGLAEGDFSLSTNYKRGGFSAEAYYSEFHNKLGIFSGSHVGNVADLEAAFKRNRPITASVFSYDINRTYQDITHRLLKINAGYSFKKGGKLEAQFSDQHNRRDEFDVDLPYSSDPNILKLPQISFQIGTQALDLVYHSPVRNHFSGTYGITGFTQGNVFRGIRYLVPNFRNYNGGAFAIERWSKNALTLEAGVRYDYRWLRVYRINNTTLQTYHNTSTYENVTGTIGASWRASDKLSFTTNIGSAWRAPSVNELYIDGIHLSAASYEKGDSSLRSERSYNFTLSGKYESERFFAEVSVYENIIDGFIYSKPALTPITLISGTYPLFNYTQVDADLKGLDAELRYKVVSFLSLDSKISLVRGWNKSIHDWLIFMPTDRFDNSVRIELGKWSGGAGVLTVLKQRRVPPNSDYVPPPAGYSLLNANIGWRVSNWQFDLAGYNLTNVAYRDYLNKFRYYADDLGVNIVLRARLKF